MRGGRAQTALEFLVRNDLIIIVIILLVMALVYLGAVNTAVAPHSCHFPSAFTCNGYFLSSSDASLTLELGNVGAGSVVGKTLKVTAISCTTSGTPRFQSLSHQIHIQPGSSSYVSGGDSGNKITCEPAPFRYNERFNGEVCVSYTESETEISHTACGDLQTTAE